MADRKAGFAHICGVGGWVSASPRVQRVVAAHVGVLLIAGLATVASHQPRALREPMAFAAAVGPVDNVVTENPAPRGGVRLARAEASRSPRQRRQQPKRAAPPAPKARRTDWAYLAPRIRGCESHWRPDAPADYKAENPDTSASGAYQIVDATWAGRYGVEHASDATPEQQDAVAADLYRRHGTADWAASAACWH